jgi:hypothetical protein
LFAPTALICLGSARVDVSPVAVAAAFADDDVVDVVVVGL